MGRAFGSFLPCQMEDKPFFVNEEVRRRLGPAQERPGHFQAYSGTDIRAILYLPLITKGTIAGNKNKQFKVFADLQTISISSTRSVSPVRVLGRASPTIYTRGARTFAGTMVFAAINTDPFSDVFDHAVSESEYPYNTSLVADQLPPFSVVITASNESGGAAIQVIHGITLTNYGTTYSIDDLYSEVIYTFVATDVVPLTAYNMAVTRALRNKAIDAAGTLSDAVAAATPMARSVSDLLSESLSFAYGLGTTITDNYYRAFQESKLEEYRKFQKAEGNGIGIYGNMQGHQY